MSALTKQDLTALRQADSVVFHYSTHPKLTDDKPSRSYVRCIKRARNGDADAVWGYGSDDLQRDIDVEGSTFALHDRKEHGGDVQSAVTSVGSYNEAWATVVGLLRAGDVLVLNWVAGNDTDNLRDAHLTHDELYLVVHRPPTVTKHGNTMGNGKRFVFAIVDSITPPLSTARMLQRR